MGHSWGRQREKPSLKGDYFYIVSCKLRLRVVEIAIFSNSNESKHAVQVLELGFSNALSLDGVYLALKSKLCYGYCKGPLRSWFHRGVVSYKTFPIWMYSNLLLPVYY